jgi:hypothetical protein
MKNFENGANAVMRRLVSCLLVFLALISLAQAVAGATGPDQYEVDDHFYQARNLALNGSDQIHNFHDAADEDWLSFYAAKGNLYFLGTTKYPGARCNTVFELYNAEGKLIDDELGSFAGTHATGYGEPEQITWQCPADGTYYLRVRQEDPEVFGEDTEYAVYLWDGTGPQ